MYISSDLSNLSNNYMHRQIKSQLQPKNTMLLAIISPITLAYSSPAAFANDLITMLCLHTYN